MLFSLLGGFLQSVLLRMCVAMMLLLHHKCGMTQHASLEGKRFTSFEALKLSSLEHTVSWTSWLKRQWMGETWFFAALPGPTGRSSRPFTSCGSAQEESLQMLHLLLV